VGIAEGAAQASADNSAATLALIQGGAQIAGTAFSDYSKIGSGGGNIAAGGGNGLF
jgi:hypothetical protein